MCSAGSLRAKEHAGVGERHQRHRETADSNDVDVGDTRSRVLRTGEAPAARIRRGSEHLHAAGGREMSDCGDDGGRYYADQDSGNHLDRILLSLGSTKRPMISNFQLLATTNETMRFDL